jgi:predicted dehydrogenase
MKTTSSRRTFIKQFSAGISLAALAPSLSAFALNDKKKLGIALVGLGGYSKNQLAPALLETQNCYLAGIVTGTPSKIPEWQAKYNIADKNIYNYETFDSIASNPDIDIVYIVLPPSMHKEYTIRAAKAGKHVICEKPMALSVQECEEMIAACKKAKRMLSIGYRLHFEPHNLEMMRLGQQQVYGKLQHIDTFNGFKYNGDPKAWRLNKALGGGPLMDMGVYSIEGMRYTSGMEPLFVTAKEEKTNHPWFTEVEETISWELEFPGGLKATGETSFVKPGGGYLKAQAEKGAFELQPAFGYRGIKGKTPTGDMDFPTVNQQALQMDDFAQCVMQNKPTRVPGEMGLKDIKVVEAIFRSVKSRKREKV